MVCPVARPINPPVKTETRDLDEYNSLVNKQGFGGEGMIWGSSNTGATRRLPAKLESTKLELQAEHRCTQRDVLLPNVHFVQCHHT